MAHCYICDKTLTTVLMDGRDGKPRPCSECEEIIQECLNEQQEDADYAYIESDLIEYRDDFEDPDTCETDLDDA